MKKKILNLLLYFLIGIFLSLSIFKFFIYKFDSKMVIENIKTLSSDICSGRICGSFENNMIADLISKDFKDIGLTPLSNSYKEPFDIIAPALNDLEPSLSISDTTYVYGQDFKEDLLNFKENNIILNKDNNLKKYKSAFTLKKGDNTFLFFISKDFSFRSSFDYKSDFSFAIALKKECFDDLYSKLLKGEILKVTLPYSNKKEQIYNVSGMVEGIDKSLPPLIISAHFDHLGKDLIGNTFHGALDNASGTAFLIELARHFASMNKPQRTIIFLALNAEEFGLLGSSSFANKYSKIYKDAISINLDMLGSKDFPINFTLSKGSENSNLLSSLENICIKENLKTTKSFEDSSDHASFSKVSWDSLTISHSDTSKIHTPNDVYTNIDKNSLDDIFKVVNNYVLSNCYSLTSFFITNDLLYFSLFAVILILLLFILSKKVYFFFYYSKK